METTRGHEATTSAARDGFSGPSGFSLDPLTFDTDPAPCDGGALPGDPACAFEPSSAAQQLWMESGHVATPPQLFDHQQSPVFSDGQFDGLIKAMFLTEVPSDPAALDPRLMAGAYACGGTGWPVQQQAPTQNGGAAVFEPPVQAPRESQLFVSPQELIDSRAVMKDGDGIAVISASSNKDRGDQLTPIKKSTKRKSKSRENRAAYRSGSEARSKQRYSGHQNGPIDTSQAQPKDDRGVLTAGSSIANSEFSAATSATDSAAATTPIADLGSANSLKQYYLGRSSQRLNVALPSPPAEAGQPQPKVDDEDDEPALDIIPPSAAAAFARRTRPQTGEDGKADIRARNRTAAVKCRAKARESVKKLKEEEKIASAEWARLSAESASLRSQVLALKTEVLRHADCDCDLIHNYLMLAALQVTKGMESAKQMQATQRAGRGEEIEDVAADVREP